MSQSDPSSVVVCMDVSVMGESGGGVKDLEHIALASLSVLFSVARMEYWLLVLVVHREEVAKACIVMWTVNFEK